MEKQQDVNYKEMFRVLPTNPEQTEFAVVVGNSLATNKRFATESEAWEYMENPKWDTTLSLFAEMIDIKFKQIHEAEMLKAEEEVKDELNN